MKLSRLWGFPGGSVVKNLPAKQKMWVRSLGQEDPLEKEMATHSKILAWAIPWTEELQSMGSQRVAHDLVIKQEVTSKACWLEVTEEYWLRGLSQPGSGTELCNLEKNYLPSLCLFLVIIERINLILPFLGLLRKSCERCMWKYLANYKAQHRCGELSVFISSLSNLLRKFLNKKNGSQKAEVGSKGGWGESDGKEKLAVRTSFLMLAVNLQSIL